LSRALLLFCSFHLIRSCQIPGPVNTELFNEGENDDVYHPLSAFGHIGEVPDITKVVLFLASSEAGWITVKNIGVNGRTA